MSSKHFQRECIAGFGHTHSLWFHFGEGAVTAYTVETPGAVDTQPPDIWFDQHFLILRSHPKSQPKSSDVLPCLTVYAGNRAVQAVRDYHVYELAIALTSHYNWQLINGAKPLPDLNELAKVYAGPHAVYLFATNEERRRAEEYVVLGNWHG